MPVIERGGASSFFVDGATYQVAAEVTINYGGIVYKEIVSSNGDVGLVSSYEAAGIEADFLDGPAVSIAALKAIRNKTIQVQMNNGKSYILVNGSHVDKVSAKVAEGKIPGLKFVGSLVKEVLATS